MVPPLGEAYLASYLINQGHEVKLLDLTLSNDYKQDVSKAIYDFNPQVIGISIVILIQLHTLVIFSFIYQLKVLFNILNNL